MRFLPLLALLMVLLSGTQTMAQRPNAAPTMLTGPADWRFERLPIPPGFARDIAWTGFEEARFAPGMFDTSSPTYFTYALAVQVDGTPPMQAAELKDFLDKYYKGLSLMIGRKKGLSPDASQFGADVTAREGEPAASGKFSAKVSYFDTFNDGRKIELHMEIDVLPRPDAKKTVLLLLISPQATDAPIWKQLRDLRPMVQKP